MLFDLRGRGRRRTVQAIYLSLALLMGGGLVLFGIGSSTSGGGILDAVVGDGSSGSSATETIDKRIKAAIRRTRATPNEPAVWAELARLRYQRAGIDGIGADDATYTDKGKQKLRLATQAWERHLALDPKQPNVRAARLMVQAYAKTGLDQPAKAVQAMQIVTAAEKPPSSNLYAQLAQLAYQALDMRTGDLAADRAVELANKSDKKPLREALDRVKTQAAQPPPTTTTATG
ncbi:MAG: hypothetical protein QOG56_1618 [Solirubrobacteraceae bacterium]|jgi:hypothetical protein|nr:hypothetical protein [Solirubrobacteraceae bacterium]